MSITTASELLTQDQLREEYGPSVPTLERWRRTGTGPKYLRIGNRVRYRRSDVEAWLTTREVAPRSA